MTDDDNGPEFGLVMPFLPVASRGGPFDDEAYVAGYEMGALSATLSSPDQDPALTLTMLTANREQADLIAMRHGWSVEWLFADDSDTWATGEFLRTSEEQR